MLWWTVFSCFKMLHTCIYTLSGPESGHNPLFLVCIMDLYNGMVVMRLIHRSLCRHIVTGTKPIFNKMMSHMTDRNMVHCLIDVKYNVYSVTIPTKGSSTFIVNGIRTLFSFVLLCFALDINVPNGHIGLFNHNSPLPHCQDSTVTS